MTHLCHLAVVPGYYLVCYNRCFAFSRVATAVVPGYYLVCYNPNGSFIEFPDAVVPGYYLVCYNGETREQQSSML